MPSERCSISYFIRKSGLYYTDGGWDRSVSKSCLYPSLHSAKDAVKGLRGRPDILCVIQNASFDYYDGRRFVYDLASARLYGLVEAEAELEKLKERR